MKNFKIFSLALLAVAAVFFTGVQQLSRNQSGGQFFIFVGACTAVGLTIDIVNHIRERIRKNNVRKLLP
jgi:hypothetical protein